MSSEALLSHPLKQERTASWSHNCTESARLLFLFSHGVLVCSVSLWLERLSQAPWFTLFLPAWIGNGLCVIMFMAAWFVSCPYIKLCLSYMEPRMGDDNPSILTEILPELMFAVVGFLFVLLISAAEYMLCLYLSAMHHGARHGAWVVALFACVAALILGHGICLTNNSVQYVLVGSGLLATIVFFVMTQGSGPEVQCLVVLPAAMVIVGFICAGVQRFFLIRKLLSKEERLFRIAESVMLWILFVVIALLMWSLHGANLVVVKANGVVAGIAVCLITMLRARMHVLEARKKPLAERLLVELTIAEEDNPPCDGTTS